MAQIREIKKRRIAVGTIQRITKTMQMIATAKFTAAVQRATATKPYTNTIRQLVTEVLEAAGEAEHPLLAGPPEAVGRELLLVISSDRGMCGAYNSNVLRVSNKHVHRAKEEGLTLDVEVSGKKAVGFFKFARIELAARHTIGDKPVYDDVEALASRFIEAFSAGTYDAIRIAYMRYESNARQIPELMQLLPIRTEEITDHEKSGGPSANYEFCPSEEALLADLIPAAVKARLFQAFNDAVVSEQIMRMVAMKAATENAKDLGRMLTRQFNRARQAQITTELSEIIGGTAALE